MEKIAVNLIPLAELGGGRAEITDSSVDIDIAGINGSLKAWLTGGEAVPIGNIVGGRLRREIDTTGHNGILVTQSGRQMLYAEYRRENEEASAQKAPAVFTETMHSATAAFYGEKSRQKNLRRQTKP